MCLKYYLLYNFCMWNNIRFINYMFEIMLPVLAENLTLLLESNADYK